MATSPLGDAGLPGPEVLGFVACGAVVRRAAYLEVGGFDPRFHIGGEEELLALDLRRHGWRSAYVAEVEAHHAPDASDVRFSRRATLVRNALWTAWLRRRPISAVRVTIGALLEDTRDAAGRAGVVGAVRGAPGILVDRVALPVELERARRLLDRDG